MNKKNTLIFAILGLIVVVVLIIVLSSGSKNNNQTANPNTNNISDKSPQEREALVTPDEASVEYALETYETL